MIGRRAFLGVTGLAALGQGCAHAAGRGALPLGVRHIVDLTHTLTPRFPYIPVHDATFPFQIRPIATIATRGVYANAWTLTEHIGTHIDAPCHFVEGGLTLDALALTDLLVPLAVIDFRGATARSVDATLTVADVLAWEAVHGRLPARAAVMLHTGWDARVQDAEAFVNEDARHTMHFPGFSVAAIDFLCTSRDVAGVGTDALSFDPGNDAAFSGHRALFRHARWGVECVANLGNVPPVGATLFVGATKVEGASGGPARLLAVW